MKKTCENCKAFGIYCTQEVPEPTSRLQLFFHMFYPVLYHVYIDKQDALIFEKDIETCPARKGEISPKLHSENLIREFKHHMAFSGKIWGSQ